MLRKTSTLSVVLYVSGTWTLSQEERRCHWLFWKENSQENVRTYAGQRCAEKHVKLGDLHIVWLVPTVWSLKRLHWAGHVVKIDDSRII